MPEWIRVELEEMTLRQLRKCQKEWSHLLSKKDNAYLNRLIFEKEFLCLEIE